MRRLTTICAALACLVLASPAAAAAFTLTVTPAEATGNQPIHLTISNLPKSVRPSGVEVKVRDAYKGCESEPSGWVWNGYAPNERGFFELCGYLWEGTGAFHTECGGGSCRTVEETRIIEEAETTFNVTASTSELKEAKEREEANEVEVKHAKEAQERSEREAAETKAATEAKEAQERTARVEAENKAQEAQRAELEHNAAVAAQEAARNAAAAGVRIAAEEATDRKLFCEDEPTALLPDGTRCPNTTPRQGNAIAPPTTTKVQKLAKALKACKKLKKHSKRAACEKRAKRRW
jgi:hypothetical protein